MTPVDVLTLVLWVAAVVALLQLLRTTLASLAALTGDEDGDQA